jgi:hypothetical protein
MVTMIATIVMVTIVMVTMIAMVMKENINRNRTNFDGYKISYLMISNYWFLGFVEGDGSFFLCNNRAIFSITHKDRQVLEAISLYIKRAPIFKDLFVGLHPNCIISGKIIIRLIN